MRLAILGCLIMLSEFIASDCNLLDAALPNIVYIIADDMTYRDYGFMGSHDALTPNLDRLASQSAAFVNGYVPTSLCSPSLAVLLTGRYPHQSGLHYNHPPPGNAGFNRMQNRTEYEAARSVAFEWIRQQPTLPRTLGALGYRSFQTGKFWEGHYSNAGFSDGMTVFEPAPQLPYEGVTRILKDGSIAAHGNGDHGLAIGRETMQPIADFLDRGSPTQPFFIWYAPYLPHQPHNSPRKYFDLYRERDIAEHRLPYLASISQFDATVGELVSMIENRGLASQTLFVFVCDNGWTPSRQRDSKRTDEFVHTHESKYSPFEDGLRTPILLRWDGHTQVGVQPQLVSSVDLLPTVLEAIGKPKAIAKLPGRSLWSAAIGEKQLDDRPVFGEIYPGDASQLGNPSHDIAYRWVRNGDFKLIVPHSHQGPAAWKNYLEGPALFNIARDLEEKNNLAGQPQYAATLQELQSTIDEWWTPGDDLLVPKPRP